MTRLGRSALTALVLAGASAGCSSSAPGRSVTNAGPTSAATSIPTTSAEQLQVTVPDCGAGAYRPVTLLIVCTTGGTMATNIQWTAWSPAGANGVGTVHLQGGAGSGMADLMLSDVTEKGTTGPQFTRLTVNWIGKSPDGRASESFPLGNGS